MPRIKHILVIEDDPEEADLIQLLVERCMADTKVSVVHQAESALTYIAGSIPTLILLDLYLPVLSDGLELISRLQSYFIKFTRKPLFRLSF